MGGWTVWPVLCTTQQGSVVSVLRGRCCWSVCGGETRGCCGAAGSFQSHRFPISHCASGAGLCLWCIWYHYLIFDVLPLVSRKCKNTTCSAVRRIQCAYTLYSSVLCALLTKCAKWLSGSGPSQWGYQGSATVFRKTSQCLQSSCG